MHDILEARPISFSCQILSLVCKKCLQLTPWPFQVGLLNFGTAILGFWQDLEFIAGHQAAVFSKVLVCVFGGGSFFFF